MPKRAAVLATPNREPRKIASSATRTVFIRGNQTGIAMERRPVS
jgi:hypothetical protein